MLCVLNNGKGAQFNMLVLGSTRLKKDMAGRVQYIGDVGAEILGSLYDELKGRHLPKNCSLMKNEILRHRQIFTINYASKQCAEVLPMVRLANVGKPLCWFSRCVPHLEEGKSVSRFRM